MARPTEVSIWVSELKAGTLPPVCVKSGRKADSKVTFEFVTYKGLARAVYWNVGPGIARFLGRRARGPVPLTKGWRATFIAFHIVTIATAAVALVFLISIDAAPPSWRPALVGCSLGSIVTCFVTHVIYSSLRPQGRVNATPEGQAWVLFKNVHPNFVDAVNAMRR